MKIATISFEVEDNFTVGDCYECPMYVDEYHDRYGDTEYRCALGDSSGDCKILLREGEK